MAVSTGDTITAAQYNDLQSRVNTVMGVGSGTDGYGQTLASAQVSISDTVTAAQMDNLRTDVNKANNHQQGSNANIGDIAVGDVIGADTSGASVAALTETTKGFNDYDNAITLITTNKDLLDLGNASVEASGSNGSRTTNWNGTITHEFTVSFNDANHRRHFFNAGGQIRFSANLSGQSGAKSNDWSTLLSNMGTITFNRNTTTASGTGVAQAIGNFGVTGAYQNIFTKVGSGNYAENDYSISVKQDSTSVLRFQITFNDDDTGDQTGSGPPEDENVNGNLSSVITQLRATGANVEVATPAYSNVINLA